MINFYCYWKKYLLHILLPYCSPIHQRAFIEAANKVDATINADITDADAPSADIADADVADRSLYVADLGEYVHHAPFVEPDMLDPLPPPRPLAPADGPIVYTEVDAASNKGHTVLVDSLGYQYTQKVDKRRNYVTWRCFKRRVCRATVMVRNGDYVPPWQSATHMFSPNRSCTGCRVATGGKDTGCKASIRF